MIRFIAAVLLAVVLLAGCGGDDQTQKTLTIPSDGRFAATKVPTGPASPALCRAKADSFSRAAESFLLPYPSDSDIYRVLARVQFTAFQAYHCDIEVLRRAVARRLTPKELREVLAFFGFMGDVGPELANAPQH